MSQTLTERRVRRLASDASFERGACYFRERRVLSLVERADSITAKVRGSAEYSVRLEAAADRLQHRCTCPVGTDGAFCKHAVAVALAWLAGRTTKADENSPIVKLDDVQPWLVRQDKCRGELLLRLAAIREKTHPADAIPLYLRHAEALVAQKNNGAYGEAARHLKKVKSLQLALDRAEDWAALRARLWTEHKAKRNFMALVAGL